MAKPDAPMTVGELETKVGANPSPETVALLAAFQDTIRTIVTEIRKPPIDPIKEVQKKREYETKVKGEAEYWRKTKEALTRCSHMRQNGTSNIGWATQSDGIERGVCPYCKSAFGPELEAFGPEFVQLYEKLRRMPRGMIEAVRNV
jgi:hypothetical protein